MKRLLFSILTFMALTSSSSYACGTYMDVHRPQPKTVEIAICLDTSNSMDGLIDSARQTLWTIVNDLALAEPTPRLRVALLTYGSPSFPEEDGWVVVNTPFTEDLDLVSNRLFALRTNGGTEFVGRVLGRAASELDWSDSESDLRIAIVAGNESADQDRKMRYQAACKSLIESGIMVNAIYCGSSSDNLAPTWRNVATLADGHFAAIDQNNGTVVIASPFDDELAALSKKLNMTYVAYGVDGQVAWANQSDQDANAEGFSTAVAAQRSRTKATELYYNPRWDLVDASKEPDFDIDAIKTDLLPESMRGMSREEKLAHIENMHAERVKIKEMINDLNAKRDAFVAKEREKLATEDKSLDGAIRKAIRAQAGARGFQFPEAPMVSSSADANASIEASSNATP